MGKDNDGWGTGGDNPPFLTSAIVPAATGSEALAKSMGGFPKVGSAISPAPCQHKFVWLRETRAAWIKSDLFFCERCLKQKEIQRPRD